MTLKELGKLPESKLPVVWTQDASGAEECARAGLVTIIVDVIDMSTSIEALLALGAVAALGASPEKHICPVYLNPLKVARAAADLAQTNGTEIIIIAEPRLGLVPEDAHTERQNRAKLVLTELARNQIQVAGVVPNLGGELGTLVNPRGKVVIAVTATGGTAYDAAFNVAGTVELLDTATIARVKGMTGPQVMRRCLERVIRKGLLAERGLGFVAASGRSIEDILAAEYLARQAVQFSCHI